MKNMVAGTPSQQASAACHLERRAEWRYVRVNGTRYVVMPSGTSGKTYWVRDDADACLCLWYQRTWTSCSHMIALRKANAEDAAPKPRARYEDLFPACKTDGCHDIAEGRDGFCDHCGSNREWGARRENQRQGVA